MPLVKLKSRIPQIQAELVAKSEGVMKAGAEAVSVGAKMRAPDAPPEGEGLVEAIHVEDDVEGFYVVAGDDDVFYGHFVENGTVKQPPRPFLIPALEAAAPGIIAGVQRVLRGI
jgi:HK97 gp10 family phage protein